MADAIVSVVLKQLTSTIFEEMQDEVRLVTGVGKEIEKLTSNFQAIQAVLLDAEQRQVKDKALGFWLDRLKDAAYDIDDILDEWRTAILKLQIEGAEDVVAPKKVCFFFCCPGFCFKQVGLHRDIALKIREKNEKLDVIVEEKDRFNLNMIRSSEEPQRLKSTSFDDDLTEVRGREEEKRDLVSKLLSELGEGLHIISIVGMGGIGKTTLAQLVYNDEEVKNSFRERIWVCVSDPFDEIRIAKAIIEALEGKSTDLVELQSLLVCIRDLLAEKKFLLVLDDVWTGDYKKWGPLCNSLNNGLLGSKIVVTTRKENVARMMKSIDVINVGKLCEEESWSLFKQIAFRDRSLEECTQLEKYGREIVGKCKGLPLAVKTVGSLLRFKKMEEQWKRILESEMWNLEALEEGVFAPLLLSYNNLPSMVKQCFSYCAIFPKDYIMDKDDLIRLWMAQGYFGLKQNEEMELFGEECFDNLAMHSFFQEFKKDEEGNVVSCKMHDIVHDFAQYTVKNECLTMKISSRNAISSSWSYETARHLMLTLDDNEAPFPFKKGSVLKQRSLFFKSEYYGTSFTSNFLPNLFKSLPYLRTLTVACWIEKIPKEIKQLIHLRYLNLSSLELEELPENLCELYNLETLNIRYCRSLIKLPQQIGKLINLRHLLNHETDLRYLPKGIERLTCLRTLDKVVIGSDSDGSEVCTLECLEKLNHLRGSLKIRVLGNVLNEAEAKNAQLQNKNKLIRLELRFLGIIDESSMRNNEAVLESIQAPPNLEKLKIQCFKGVTMSFDWMVSLTRLKELILEDCIRCEHLPPLGKLPSLESLHVYDLGSVRIVSNEFLGTSSSSDVAFPRLNRLSFFRMFNWKDWYYYEIKRTEEQVMEIMPRLSILRLHYCPELKTLPDHLVHAALHNTLQIQVDGCGFVSRKLRSARLQHHMRILVQMTLVKIHFKKAVKRARAKFSGPQ